MSTNQTVFVFAGTKKGAFIFKSNTHRQQWQVEGPHFPGWSVHHLIYHPYNGYLYAALDHAVYGSNIHRSPDMGQTWEIAEGLTFGEEKKSVTRVWHIHPGHISQPNVVYAGGDPGLLFKSEDAGKSWVEVLGINQHPTRHTWFPGAGGNMVHTIVQDPTDANRLFVAISTGGVFRTDDGGATWQPKNKGVLAGFMPDPYPEVGQCCHHLVMSHANPQLLFQQNHCGVYASQDAGENWTDIGAGLPATFGFPMAIQGEQTIYTVPQVSDEYRYTPEGKFRVYRSRTGGQSWEALANGLPQENAYLGVYREAMSSDSCTPAGVYVGTATGQLFYSSNEGDAWQLLSPTLPPIYGLSVAVIE